MNKHHSRAPLRLLLVAAGPKIPNWLFHCMDTVERAGAGRCVLVLRPARTEHRGVVTFVQRWRQLLFSLHAHLDRYLFRRRPDALASIDLQSALPTCRVFAGTDVRSAAVGSPSADTPLAGVLRDAGIDVVVDPFCLMPDGWLAGLARYGVWSTAFGGSGDAKSQSLPAFWEVIEGTPSTEARLCIHRNGCDERRSLYVSVAPTDRRSVSRSQNHVYWKISAALARLLQLLWEDPDAFVGRLRAAAPFAVAKRPLRPPGNLQMLRAWTHLIRRYASDKWMSALHRERWELAWQCGPGHPFDLETSQKLIPPADRFWADPFPVHVGDDYYIFHEEMLASANKGSIVVTRVDHAGHPMPPVPVLERDHHLAYPCVFQWDGEFFMMPETASLRRVELYRCVSFPAHWKLERVVLSGVTAFDPTPAFLFGRWWLFANIPAYGAGTMDELHVFHADSPLGPWTPHRRNPIKSDVRSARPAGRPFERHGQVYRPAQDCSRRYGYAVSINRILELTPETYEEVEVDKIVPSWGRHVAGVHTFNVAGQMTVIDCLVRRSRFWTEPRR